MQFSIGAKELVFLYGTLKRGHYNYETYLSKALETGHATFVGKGKTCDNNLILVIQTERNVPFLYFPPTETKDTNYGKQIHGEIYQVSKSCLKGLDLLEDVASGFYERRSIRIIQTASSTDVGHSNEPMSETKEEATTKATTNKDCWVYGRQVLEQKDFMKLTSEHELLSSFDDTHNNLYIPRDTTPKMDILQCMIGNNDMDR